MEKEGSVSEDILVVTVQYRLDYFKSYILSPSYSMYNYCIFGKAIYLAAMVPYGSVQSRDCDIVSLISDIYTSFLCLITALS